MVPLDVDGDTGSVDGSGWRGRRRQGEATTARTTMRFLNIPSRGIIRDEVNLEKHLKFSEGRSGKGAHKRTSEEGDGMSDGLRKVGRGRGHGWKDRKI